MLSSGFWFCDDSGPFEDEVKLYLICDLLLPVKADAYLKNISNEELVVRMAATQKELELHPTIAYRRNESLMNWGKRRYGTRKHENLVKGWPEEWEMDRDVETSFATSEK
ncbi:unnamed protein product [Cercopithifilaria johnstoni]|uniref:Uncharacterized protein n=1 Tax=Cercopithifilaria johnstoni TaxID=2874296 RepID=A0A8J2M8D0_9BILA|nr:unnamed protein product [Cercopithifilaria johnstoni]